ncbi:MAG: dihydropteroate synthase [Deltaproteobacteria bacterium]
MNLPVRCLNLTSIKRAEIEMERIGVDPAGIRIMAPKQLHYNLKIEGLKPSEANILKQEMLSIGAEAAVSKGAASCAVASTDALLSGTLKQFSIITDKLKTQALRLPAVSEAIAAVIANIGLREFSIPAADTALKAGPKPLIMGILNVTPDSFSDGGRFLGRDAALQRALEMRDEGADWIDVGGESTRPGAAPVELNEELKRVMPVVEALSGHGLVVSIDTTKAEVARQALAAGAKIVNDVSALSMDRAMAAVCAASGAAVVLMHMEGMPRTMRQDKTHADIVGDVCNCLDKRIEYAVSSGIQRGSIIVDPGIGFGKSMEDDLMLVKNLSELKSLGRPMLLGPSRKSFVGKAIGAGIEQRLFATISIVSLGVANGACILRVHDVKEARQAADMAWSIVSAGEGV